MAFISRGMVSLLRDGRIVSVLVVGCLAVGGPLGGVAHGAPPADKSKPSLLKAFNIDLSGVLKAAPAPSEDATHRQVDVIRPTTAADEKLTCFCLADDGRIVTVVTKNETTNINGARVVLPAAASTSSDDDEAVCEVRILDADGELLETWPVDFKAQAVNVGPEGHVYVGGDGLIARFDSTGKLLVRAEAPHVVASREDPEALDRQAKEMVEQQRSSLDQMVKQFEAQKKPLDDRDEDALSDAEKQQKQQLEQMIKIYKQAAEQQSGGEEAVERMKQSLLGRQRTINAIAASDKHIFITCSASKGYGYAVWRTDLDFANPQMTVDGLRGCCGQMDVQCCDGELIVAENSRHRVVRFDADGNEVIAFGKRDRDGRGDCFGGCCNPMNTRLVGDKLYVAESDGQVKLFSPEGEYQGLVGKANVQAGCKSSIVAATPDGKRVYYFDVTNSAICVLDRSDDDAAAVR